jgi:hypothetical protein
VYRRALFQPPSSSSCATMGLRTGHKFIKFL